VGHYLIKIIKTFFQPEKSALELGLDPLFIFKIIISLTAVSSQGAQGIHGLYLCGYLQEGQASNLNPGS